jgi:hypothetical protein
MYIFDMADQNSDSLKTQYNLLKKRYEAQNNFDIFSNFVELVKDKWSFSINMKQWVLNTFLSAGKYENIYEVRREQGEELRSVSDLEISEEQALELHLGGYYNSRVAFDRTFEGGEKFKYGALNIGGPGLKRYGDYCVVLKRKQSEEYSSLAFIKEDSLNYVDEYEHHVKIERLSQDIANRECVHLLVTLKHENDIAEIPDDKWVSMLCCDECYIEAITTDDILNEHIESVRMSKKDYQRYYFDYLFRDYSSEISNMERYQLYMLLGIFKLLDKQGIKLEVIDEN